ncbi:unnamed protein product, partial [Brassica napus]
LKKKKSKQRYVVSSLNFLSPSHHRRFFSGLTISTRDEIPLTPHHLISSHHRRHSSIGMLCTGLGLSPSLRDPYSSTRVQRRDPNRLISSRSQSDQQAG